jgi:hypothetical protein
MNSSQPKLKVLIDKINFEPHAEDTDGAYHPFTGLSINEVKAQIQAWEDQFPGYEHLDLKVQQNWVGFGGLYSEWYQLVGYPTPLAEALDE